MTLVLRNTRTYYKNLRCSISMLRRYKDSLESEKPNITTIMSDDFRKMDNIPPGYRLIYIVPIEKRLKFIYYLTLCVIPVSTILGIKFLMDVVSVYIYKSDDNSFSRNRENIKKLDEIIDKHMSEGIFKNESNIDKTEEIDNNEKKPSIKETIMSYVRKPKLEFSSVTPIQCLLGCLHVVGSCLLLKAFIRIFPLRIYFDNKTCNYKSVHVKFLRQQIHTFKRENVKHFSASSNFEILHKVNRRLAIFVPEGFVNSSEYTLLTGRF